MDSKKNWLKCLEWVDIRKEMGLQISDEIVLTYQDNSDMREVMSLYVDEIKKKLLAKEIVPGKETKVEKL